MSPKSDAITGAVGFSLTITGVITSMQEQLLWGAQFCAALGAVAVAVLTAIKLSRKRE